MSHGAAGGFADVVEPENVIKVFPTLKPLFEAVLKHEAYGVIATGTSAGDYADFGEVEYALTENGYSDMPEEKVTELAKSWATAYVELQNEFQRLTGATLALNYLDEDNLDSYAGVRGTFWSISGHQQYIPSVRQAVADGLEIDRCFFAVYG